MMLYKFIDWGVLRERDLFLFSFAERDLGAQKKRKKKEQIMVAFSEIMALWKALYGAAICVAIGFPLLLVQARFVVETNSVSISSPESLKGTYDSAIGNFGVPQYGGTLSGTVVYASDNPFACDAFSSANQFKPRAGSPPTIVLVDRGGKIS